MTGQQGHLTSPPAALVSSPAPGLLSRHPCLAWQTEELLAEPSTQLGTSMWLQMSCPQRTGNLSDTCFLLLLLQQQQQQQTPKVIRIVPPTTDMAMIRASKFTGGFDKTHLGHKSMAVWQHSICKHLAAVNSSFSYWTRTMHSSLGRQDRHGYLWVCQALAPARTHQLSAWSCYLQHSLTGYEESQEQMYSGQTPPAKLP